MTREERRAAMPQVSAWVDEIRKHFGEPNAITASENDKTIKWRKSADEGKGNPKKENE